MRRSRAHPATPARRPSSTQGARRDRGAVAACRTLHAGRRRWSGRAAGRPWVGRGAQGSEHPTEGGRARSPSEGRKVLREVVESRQRYATGAMGGAARARRHTGPLPSRRFSSAAVRGWLGCAVRAQIRERVCCGGAGRGRGRGRWDNTTMFWRRLAQCQCCEGPPPRCSGGGHVGGAAVAPNEHALDSFLFVSLFLAGRGAASLLLLLLLTRWRGGKGGGS